MVGSSAFASLRSFICNRHNGIQLIGFEGANIALLMQQGLAPEKTALPQTLAAIAFMIGSLAICLFNPKTRPAALMWGGVGLAIGGVMIIAAGYPLTGGAVALASLESARGGMSFVAPNLAQLSLPTRLMWALLRPYQILIDATVGRLKFVGSLINDRPFLTGALIKIPLRLEFIAKNIAVGDFIGAGVGLSWMILGDGGLALNDEKLKRQLEPTGPIGKPVPAIA